MELEEKVAIIEAYAETLANAEAIIISESTLPYPKEVISDVLLAELKSNDDPQVHDVLFEGFMRLELCLDDTEYAQVMGFLEKLSDTSIPEDLLNKANEIVPDDDKAVLALFEKIDKRLNERRALLEALEQ